MRFSARTAHLLGQRIKPAVVMSIHLRSASITVEFVHVGTDAEPAAFKTAYGLQPGGATLRPDGYIARRSVTAPGQPRRNTDCRARQRVRRRPR
jgi:hypothetical protein